VGKHIMNCSAAPAV